MKLILAGCSLELIEFSLVTIIVNWQTDLLCNMMGHSGLSADIYY